MNVDLICDHCGHQVQQVTDPSKYFEEGCPKCKQVIITKEELDALEIVDGFSQVLREEMQVDDDQSSYVISMKNDRVVLREQTDE